jgi:peptidoglycan/xylan/chitin deacetylase (PgdA/CDA1 family)
VTAVVGAAALLLTVVGLKVAELVEVSQFVAGSRPPAMDRIEIEARPIMTETGVSLEAEGTPGAVILVLQDGRPLTVLTLDDEGQATIEGLEGLDGDGPLQLVPLSSAVVDVDLPELTEPSPTDTPVPPEPTATATPRPSAAEGARAAAKIGPTPLIAPPVLQLVQDAGPRIAITFDGNASTNRTAELLDMLQRHDLEVTLFVTGRFIERYPEIVRRAVLSGHEIGNHTYSHPHLTTYEQDRRHRLRSGVTKASFQRELRRTEAAFAKATGHAMQPLWRAPYGEENRLLRGWALEMGYLHVRWSSLEGKSLDSHDWVADEHSSLYKSSRTIMERLLQFPKLEGGIILMHMATERQEPPWQELPVFLEALEERGMETTTVTRLLEASPSWSKWLRRARERHQQVNGN